MAVRVKCGVFPKTLNQNRSSMPSEVEARADFSEIRYAQVWEDADVLLEALNIQPGETCVSIASAGDNALAMLAKGAGRVIAVDLNPAQIMCLELRVAAYRRLSHPELLELMGSRPSSRRMELYGRCRPELSEEAKGFWDAHGVVIQAGIGSGGKFERYFRLFKDRIIPLVHGRKTVEALLQGGDRHTRSRFYESRWNTWRWRLLFKVFFSRFLMGRLGRDPEFFKYVEGSVADRILARTRHALTELDPRENPYLHWILLGTHREALPLALRAEHFEAIRDNLHRLEWRLGALEDVLDELGDGAVDRFNLSDIFEYMGSDVCAALLERLARSGRQGARLAYWNMLAPRARPESLAHRLRAVPGGAELLAKDKAWFYSAFVLEEVL
jgi:S-adenosylmethionine-diacylglycerol 3-amino-3-carboxypropyl transferase